MLIIIDIYSKNVEVLNSFVNKFFTKAMCKKLKLIILKTTLQKPKTKKVFTALKSPHVNKTSQEQFEYRIYRKQIKCVTFQTLLFLVFLKKIKFFLVSDIDVKITLIKKTTNLTKKIKHQFNVDSFCFHSNKFKLVEYLTFFEFYGEFFLKSKVGLDSSAG